MGYSARITHNDGAMIGAMSLLREVAAGDPPFGFVGEARRARAAEAVDRGIDYILRTQVEQCGLPTAWCAQHDEQTLEPAWAWAYEPPSLSGAESVGIVRFLMEVKRPTPEIIAAVEGATSWFRAAAIPDIRLEAITDPEGRRNRRVVPDPAAGPHWARFYELGTDRLIFVGRDSVVRYANDEIEQERRVGYSYYGTWPTTLLGREYPRWRERHGLAPE